MGIQHFTYLDLPSELRKKAVSEAKKQLRSQLSTRGLTFEHRETLLKKLTQLTAWEEGVIPVVMPSIPAFASNTIEEPSPPTKPVNHTIVLKDAYTISDKG